MRQLTFNPLKLKNALKSVYRDDWLSEVMTVQKKKNENCKS